MQKHADTSGAFLTQPVHKAFRVRLVSEAEFRERFFALLDQAPLADIGSVAGPGRSGAIAAVYASHHLRVPFVPYGAPPPRQLGRLLIVDTATQSGKTLLKAARKYRDADPYTLAAFDEPPRVYFWYERPKPQRYRHEDRPNDNGAFPLHRPTGEETMSDDQEKQHRVLFTVIETIGEDGRTYMQISWRHDLYPVLDEISPNGELTDKIIDIAEEIVQAMDKAEAA